MDLSKVIESLYDFGLYELNFSGQVIGWSSGASRLMGFSANDVTGRYLIPLAAEGSESTGLASLQIAMREGRSEFFGWAIRNDGSRFWANEVTTPIRDDSGKITGFAGIIRNVTSWKTAEDERDRFFSLSGDLICVAGFDGSFKRINPAFTDILGYSDKELLGKPFIDFVHPDDVAATQQEVGRLSDGTNKPRPLFQNRYRRIDGKYCWIQWKSSPMPEGRMIYAVGRDISEQKAVEQKLQDYAKELERSNGELQQFSYVASHDLQEPLRAVAGCVQMIGERLAGKLDDRSVELMEHATDGAKRMQVLINDLLAYSRVGSKGIHVDWIDPRSTVEKAIKQLNVAITESDALITIDALPHVTADAVQLTQLFQNLIGNAIKFRAERRPEIRVRAEQKNGETIFSVQDNGIGIAPEYQEKVFGLFQRLHRRKEYSGTGIGLAICRKIVERHAGRIWIESEPGAGACFRFSIPNVQK